MGTKYGCILSAEESFARRVALGVIVKQPVKAWQQIIPGMFIFDFLKRNRAIRDFSKYYLFPRRAALDAAREVVNGEDKAQCLKTVEEQAHTGPARLNLRAPGAQEAWVALVGLLMEHYGRLLQADGETYDDMVQGAYGSKKSYAAHADQLASLERRFGQEIIKSAGESGIQWQRLQDEQKEVELQRTKERDSIFWG